ncbi:hypothetical protein Adeh_0758 [Anaeromyxobacter dehalogenans 2CP-C]|uniref:Uncharacterized protein n=1 Tax=Anaeromyxobacter dehalogenans (strain 2CP-C) TaxID=290397 RepID=Q2INZ8_ANADE|nr:hypothetical protein Adeh_0758 [Anaeromyxobacter dehalogenans 2CP-C]
MRYSPAVPPPADPAGAFAPVLLVLAAVLAAAVSAGVRTAGARAFAQRAAGGAAGAAGAIALALAAQALVPRTSGDALVGLYLLLIGPGLSALVAGGVLGVEVLTRRGVSVFGLARTAAAASLSALAWLLGFPMLFGRPAWVVAVGWGLALAAVVAVSAAAHGLGGRRRAGAARAPGGQG